MSRFDVGVEVDVIPLLGGVARSAGVALLILILKIPTKGILVFEDIIEKTPKSVAVIGAAKSGVAAAKYFLARGGRVFISDVCGRERLDRVLSENQLDSNKLLDSEAGGHTDKILENELIILSPGVRGDLDVLKSAASKGIPVWSEMELGFRVSKAPFLAVTGSSGKSTTVSLLASAMTAAGFETALAGNIGTPVVDVTPRLPEDAVVVAEVSSFQLEAVDKFKPKVAAVINLMKNHLDRYACEDDYYNAKKLIAKNLTMGEYLVLNADDSRLSRWAGEFKGQTRIFMFGSRDCGGGDCVYLSGKGINYRMNGASGVIIEDTAAMRIAGRHNYINACAAAAAALAAGADPKLVGEGLCAFGGLPHRLEFVGEAGGVSFYNDSKSTTAESIECAVRAFGSKVLLIAGGKDKGCDFSAVVDSIRKNVKWIILIGEAKERMAAVWEGAAPVTKAATLEEAVGIAFKNAVGGEQVVFSPGCSSFDMFRNFEHRGDVFRDIVNGMAARLEHTINDEAGCII